MSLHQNPVLFSNLCKLVSGIGIFPIKCYPGSRKVILSKPGKGKSRRLNLTTFLVVIYFFQCVLKNNASFMESVISWIGLSMLLVCQVYLPEQSKKADVISLLAKSLFQFDSLYPVLEKQGHISWKTKWNITYVYATFVSAAVLPIGFAHGLHWMNPCKASLPGFWLLPECHGVCAYNVHPFFRGVFFLIKCFAILMTHWLWSIYINSAAFCTGAINTMFVASIHQFIERYNMLYRKRSH